MTSYKSFGVDLAYKAGDIMRKNFVLGMEKKWKEDNTPLTVSDTAINTMVIEQIKEKFPTHAVIGEEESHHKESEYIWVCDPIDGTIPFSHGIPVSTFSLALTQKGVPIFGVVYDPFLDRLFTAEKGNGAYLNDQKIYVSKAEKFENSVMSVEGKSNSDLSRSVRAEFEKKHVKLIKLASCAYCGTLVAAGEFAGFVFFPENPWDVAGIKIIIEEAGGKCTDIDGNDQRYDRKTNGLVASNGLMHEKILKIIKSAKKSLR